MQERSHSRFVLTAEGKDVREHGSAEFRVHGEVKRHEGGISMKQLQVPLSNSLRSPKFLKILACLHVAITPWRRQTHKNPFSQTDRWVLQDTLGKDVVKIGFPPAKKLGWVSMGKSSTGEQMLVCKVH